MEWSENTLGALEDGVKRSFDLLVIKATENSCQLLSDSLSIRTEHGERPPMFRQAGWPNEDSHAQPDSWE